MNKEIENKIIDVIDNRRKTFNNLFNADKSKNITNDRKTLKVK